MRFLLFLILISNIAVSQVSKPLTANIPRPKLVVGLVVDQMRWDYLYRYYDRYAPDGGFRRLLTKGFSCDNTFMVIRLYSRAPFRPSMVLPATNGGK